MKQFTKEMTMGIQGDVAFTRIDADDIPEGLVPAQAENGELIIAHSETGHNHSFDANGNEVTVLEDPDNPLVAYMHVKAPANLEHHRSYDTHETVRFEEGVYRINRQREHTPEGYRRVAD